jgi:ABC-type bacteriocin/lantibiotic exporter with double-glycine peptidase domain
MLPLFGQELETSCVAACVRMVLASLGHMLTEAEIRTRCGHSRLGMRLNQIAGGLKDLPITVEYHLDWSRDDLSAAVRHEAFPIVGLDLRPIEGLFAFHAVIVVGLKSDQVVLHDPRYSNGAQLVGLPAFEMAWNNVDREAVIIKQS